jgi:hypothetical protein
MAAFVIEDIFSYIGGFKNERMASRNSHLTDKIETLKGKFELAELMSHEC